jgi:chorismate dehydratase
MGQPAQRLRLGKIGYLNVLPIYFPLESGIVAHHFEIVSGTPAFLNRLMSQGSLELSVVSSIEYGRHPERYLILPDLSISCHGPVRSVLLLSRVPFEQLSGRTVLASIQSHTSVALLKILMLQLYGYSPSLRLGNCTEALISGPLPDALLCIGDEALQMRHNPRFPHRLDLGEAWRAWTGLPFVFALWVMQRSALERWNGHLATANTALLAAKRWGTQHLELVCEEAHKRGLLNRQELLEYYRGLAFDLGAGELDGLRLFFKLLKEMGEIPAIPSLGTPPELAGAAWMPSERAVSGHRSLETGR